jgi:hypothetical protein
MADTAPVPLRVLFKGASTVTWQSPGPDGATRWTYPRVLEQELARDGVETRTTISAMSAERATSILRTWEQEVSSHSPDVIVLHYGHMECIHGVIPRWFERHARAGTERPGPIRDRYRHHVLRPVWKIAVKGQQAIDRLLPARVFRRRPAQVVALLERYIGWVHRISDPLVVVMGLTAPGERYADWFPGIVHRTPAMEAALRDMVERLDSPRVVFLPVWDDAAAWLERGEAPVPDGAHYTPAFHRHVGARLANLLRPWIATQPHLRQHD